jgi:hypothetical protein
MTCWHGHIPRMSEAQLAQACEAYYRAAYHREWERAWQSPLNPFSSQPEQRVEWDAPVEPPVTSKPRRTTSLKPASTGDKAGAIDVEFVRVR